MKIGGVATHAYTYLKPDDYECFLNNVRPKVVIADHTTIGNIRAGRKNSRFPKAILVTGDGDLELEKWECSLRDMLRSADTHLEAKTTSMVSWGSSRFNILSATRKRTAS